MVNNGKNTLFDEIKVKSPLKRYLRQKHGKRVKINQKSRKNSENTRKNIKKTTNKRFKNTLKIDELNARAVFSEYKSHRKNRVKNTVKANVSRETLKSR